MHVSGVRHSGKLTGTTSALLAGITKVAVMVVVGSICGLAQEPYMPGGVPSAVVEWLWCLIACPMDAVPDLAAPVGPNLTAAVAFR